jgi:hypothetical protein
MSGSVRRGLSEARGILFNRLDLLKIKRETNPTIVAYVEAKQSKGDQKDVNMAVEKYLRAGGGGGCGRGGGGGNSFRVRNRQSYNARRPPFVPAHPPPQFSSISAVPPACPEALGIRRIRWRRRPKTRKRD